MKHRGVTVKANEKSHHEPEKLDLIVRGGRIVTPEGIVEGDLGIVHGKFARMAPTVNDEALAELDAAGKYVFPGILDAHVHFNEPGRTDWEGISTGSAALAAGGGTMFFDMPLNSEPPVLDAASFREKRRIAEEQSCTDFALWGGLTPENLDKLAGLRDAGAIGLKAFMCNSGIASFHNVDAKTLREGMKRAAKLGLLVAVHAEDDAMAAALTAQIKAAGRTDARAWLDSRPIEVELTAIRMALELAGETGCALHVVHVSSPEGIALISEARLQRVDVTAETCPHYLLLNDKDVERIGPLAKCAPPLRDEKRRKAMWAELRAGRIQTVGSDHSPSRPEMKDSANMFAVWGGIAGIQHGAELLLSECTKTLDKDLPVLAAVLARNVARRFQIAARKGQTKLWHDADFSLVEFGKARTIDADDLWTRHRISAYVGQKSRARVTHTYVRGSAVYADGRLTNLPKPGQFLAPHRAH
ncbi:MAG: allantoinase AllB [Verrucomicrobia bacterium]|nr:allantoinase AllB [Verrucomicrobiota bacterium]